MEILSLQIFVSLVLVGGSVLLFAFSWRQRDFEHSDRLALLPLDDESDDMLKPLPVRSRAPTQGGKDDK